MAQTTILASGTSAGVSSDITLIQGETRTVGIFHAAGDEPPDACCLTIYIDTPGEDRKIGVLNKAVPALVISGPGTFRIRRPDISQYGVSVGVFTEG